MIQPGTLLQKRYRVVRRIGHGGMGAVYAATDERFRSKVAIKQTFFNDATMSRAFEREAHLLNHLRHAALPKVSDHFTEGDGQFLVMEFIEGSDLSELLQKRGAAFPLADVLRWADELLDALDYLHTRTPPVVHRDIKPQNLKLTTRGQIVLLDFGLAKGMPAQTDAASSVFGYSRNYAPLEQMQCAGTEARSDLYSAAATLYHLMTGVLPVDALTRAAATVKAQPDPLRPAHLAHAQVPATVGKIIQRAMSQNSALRHASAAELRAALRQAAGLAQATPARTPAAVLFAERPSPTPARDATERSSLGNVAGRSSFDNAFDPDASHYSLDVAASHYSLDADAALSAFDPDARPNASAPNAPQSSDAASQFSDRGSRSSADASQSSFGAASRSSFDPTVLEPSSQAHASMRGVHASRAGSRPGVRRNSETHVAPPRRAYAPEQDDAPRVSASKVIGVAVVALVLACAAAGFVLVRRSGASANASETQTVAPSDVTTGAPGDTSLETQRTNSLGQSSSAPSQAQDAPTNFGREARSGGETSAPDTQAASSVAGASGDYTNGGSSAAPSGASNNVTPSTDATGGDKSGLVIRSSTDPGARAAAIEAEVDERARRDAEARRSAAQAAPPAGDGRRPPPPDGHRPPPPGGHPPPRYPPPRP